MLTSPSALPLYNTNKLIYKSRFFNKFKELLSIVAWFLRKEEKKGAGCLQGSGKLDKHGRAEAKEANRAGKFQVGAQRPRRQAKGPHQGRKGVCHLLLTETRGIPWPSLSSWLMCASHPGSLASTQER